MIKGLLKKSYNNKERVPEGFTIDKDLSGKRNQVFVNNKTGGVVVTTRGTSGFQDLVTDAKISLGVNPKSLKRYKQADKVASQAREKYGQPITLLGHSLGGNISETIAKKGDKVITYNKAATLQDIGKKRREGQIDIRHEDDVISALSKTQKGGKDITIKSTSKGILDAHGLNKLGDVTLPGFV
jgi:translation initiation factor IF-1